VLRRASVDDLAGSKLLDLEGDIEEIELIEEPRANSTAPASSSTTSKATGRTSSSATASAAGGAATTSTTAICIPAASGRTASTSAKHTT
jgi:hypothetical protein